jgi:hypothetical protein
LVYDVMVDERRSWDWKKRRWIDRLVTSRMKPLDEVSVGQDPGMSVSLPACNQHELT